MPKREPLYSEKEFTDVKDLLSIDYTSAYSTPSLDKLVGTFVYDRQGKGSFTVGDEFTANAPIRFETAITTQANWKIIDDTHLLLTTGTEQMTVTIKASGKVAFTSETINDFRPIHVSVFH